MANKFVLLRTPRKSSPFINSEITPCFQGNSDKLILTSLKQNLKNKVMMDNSFEDYEYVIAKIYKKGV